MSLMMEHRQEMHKSFEQVHGYKADRHSDRAEWARSVAAEIRREGILKSKEVFQTNGEVVPPQADEFLHDTLTIPDLAAVEASFDRSRLLLEQVGSNVAAMALDAANSIQASNSLEKMLAHQLAAAHKAVMEQIGVVPCSRDAAAQAKRLNAAARCMAVYQNGLLTLRKLRQSGNQRITVQSSMWITVVKP